MFCACVTRILKKPAKGKCLAFRIFRNKKKQAEREKEKEKLMGKCFEGLHYVCVRFSGLCAALVLLNLMM